jgi:ketosteroid isomerase-like protein
MKTAMIIVLRMRAGLFLLLLVSLIRQVAQCQVKPEELCFGAESLTKQGGTCRPSCMLRSGSFQPNPKAKGVLCEINIALMAVAITVISLGRISYGMNRAADDVESSVTKIEHELLGAMLAGDISKFDRYLADTYTFTDPDGVVSDKATGMADMKSGVLKFESSKMEDVKFHVYGDTAIATYGSNDRATYKGKDVSGRYRWTDVFVKRNGKSQIVAGQGTRINKQ